MFTTLFRLATNKSPRAPADRVRTNPACQPRLELLEDRCLLSGDVVLHWNQLALDAIRQVKPNPVVASRILAIEQVAVFDAVNSIDRSFTPYSAQVHASRIASKEAAAAQAAHDTLVALFPTLTSSLDAALAADLVGIPSARASQGIVVGKDVARLILALRSTDGSSAVVPYTPGTNPGDWQPTPPANLPALAPQWPLVTPWAMDSGSQFRPSPPPALGSAQYATAFNEVKSLGASASTTRTADQTEIAFFWRDAAGTSYAFGHWNEIATVASVHEGLSLVQNARLFALLNIAEADALIDTWDAKFAYNFWRPITAIRFPGDSTLNPATQSDQAWTSLLVAPNFPGYPSAHSTVSSAAAAILTSEFGRHYDFSIGSDGLAGVTRSFASFDEAAAEAGQSRIYGGIHFQFDNQAGLKSGHALGRFVSRHFLRPIENGHDDRNDRNDRDDNRHGGHSDLSTQELVFLLTQWTAHSPATHGLLSGHQQSERTGECRATLPSPQHSVMSTALPVSTEQPIPGVSAANRQSAKQSLHCSLDQLFATLEDSLHELARSRTTVPA